VASYRDGDFSLSLPVGRRDELGGIIAAHNALGAALREQRQHLVQRELLLDTVVQNSPAAMFLVDSAQSIAYTNSAACHLLNDGRSLDGAAFASVLERCPAPLRQALAAGVDGLFPVKVDDTEETYHLAQQRFQIQGRPHRLILLKRLTRELSRQEVAIWKKLIRVLSHELNNSLAPISSLAHSGAEMLRRGHHNRLFEVFESISDRSRHLHAFIEGYASFARLPAPQPREVDWKSFIDGLALHCLFKPPGRYPSTAGWFDPMQMTQALINLLKNAHESGSSPDEIELGVEESASSCCISVRDRGSGMSEAVLANALLPFYSTKRTGTGLGLPLAREVIEAHGGTITLSNREGGGGLCVRIMLPNGNRLRPAAAVRRSASGNDPT
jgi:nitrogen fixation/metabolism regulation signal transduction histidine kinase